MWLSVETLLLATMALLAYYVYNFYTYWQRRGVLQETPLPVLGNFRGVGKKYHLRDINQRLYRKYKGKAPFIGVYMFFQRSILALDLDLMKHVLIKDFGSFHDRGSYNNVRDDPLTGHLVNLEGAQWRAMRTKLTPVFTSARMKYMFPTVVKVGENFAQVVGRMAKEDPQGVVEIKDMCARFTTDVIGNCAFGIECNSLEDPNAEFRLRGRSVFENPRHSPLVQTFIITNGNLAKKLRLKVFRDEMSDFFVNVVRQTVEYRIKNNIKRNDFMDLIIELKAENEELAKQGNGIDLSHGLTIEQMAAQTFVFFLAGFETSSTTMSFCLYELSRHQDIQEQCRKEMQEVLKQHEGQLTYEGLNNMNYLEQVLDETLRLYPVLSNLVRKSNTDYKVPNSDQIIESGTMVILPVHAIHYDPEYYDNPTEFRPSRFEAAEKEKRHPCAYLPFGDGPRNCIGLRFGKMQAKIGLVSLLSRYRFEFCNETEEPLEINIKSFLLATKHGIKLKVTPL